MGGMQMALETESKGKIEALRMKKKLEADVLDLHTALEHANAANAESQRQIKVIQQRLREVQARFEEETRAKAIAQDFLQLQNGLIVSILDSEEFSRNVAGL